MVCQVYDHFHGMAHAVLYDEDETTRKNNGKYYFKNSYKREPFITVPKDRVTYYQYNMLKNTYSQGRRHQNSIRFRRLIKNWQNSIGHKMTANLRPRQTYWTICDHLYAIFIEKK